jgi:hypothetical protein
MSGFWMYVMEDDVWYAPLRNACKWCMEYEIRCLSASLSILTQLFAAASDQFPIQQSW